MEYSSISDIRIWAQTEQKKVTSSRLKRFKIPISLKVKPMGLSRKKILHPYGVYILDSCV